MEETNFDFEEEDTESTTEPTEAETGELIVDGELEVAADVAAEEDEDDDFFDEDEVADVPALDPAKVVTIRTSSTEDRYVEVPEGSALPIVDAIAKCGIRFNGDYTVWLNGSEVALGTTVGGGTVLTVVGSVKGGAL